MVHVALIQLDQTAPEVRQDNVLVFAAPMLSRILSAASQNLTSKPIFSVERLFFIFAFTIQLPLYY